MKVILSRKGFDSSYGGCASPILPGGTMMSMPIPGGEASNLKFEDIKYGEITYLDIWDKLYSKHKTDKLYCHLDPDIRADVRVKPVDNWVAAFGQTDTAQNIYITEEFLRAIYFCFLVGLEKLMKTINICLMIWISK